MLAALAVVTNNIGLVATQNTTYNDPADLAHRLASLDLISGGRAAWNIVTTDNAWTGANFRRGGYLDHADRYKHAEAFVETAKRIWDSWETPAGPGPPRAPRRPALHRGRHAAAAAQRPVPAGAVPGRRLARRAGTSPPGRPT